MMASTKKHEHRLYEKTTGWGFTAIIAIGTVLMFINGNSTKGFMGIMTVMVYASILIYQSRSPRPFPASFTIISYTFIFIAVGLGTLSGFYRVLHFDDVLHLLSGIWIGYGSLIILKLMIGKDLSLRLPKAFVALYMLCFSLGAAGLWELLEFTGDKWFHFTSQGRDHDDTMFDMINGLVGGAVTVIFFLRKRRS